MTKTTKKNKKNSIDYPWNDIKADYLHGIEPKSIAEKYKFDDINTLYNAIDNRGWKKEKTEINENIRNSVQDNITEGAKEAIVYLREVVSNTEEKTQDRIAAAKGLLSVSGLEKSEKKITGDITTSPTTFNILPVKSTNEL